MASEVQLVNRALARLGHSGITAFTDQSAAGRLATLDYAETRDDLLRAHPWRFAIKRNSLAASATGPKWEFTYAYELPTDCLLILEVNGESIDCYKWRREGSQIVTDLEAPLEIRYVAQITDPNKMDAQFRSALVIYLAMSWCEQIGGREEVRRRLEREFISKIAEARSMSAIEGMPQKLIVDAWDNARY